MPTKYTKEILEEAVKTNVSIYGVLRSIGTSTNSGGMHHYISRRIKQFEIDTSHFLGIRTNCGLKHKGSRKKKVAAEILILRQDGRKEKRNALRRALLEIGREERCEICGLGTEWNDVPLILHIDHKDGNNLDNREHNVRFLCPNCYTQTPTYGQIKTSIAERTCKECGSGIYRRNKSGFCYKCAPKARVAQRQRRGF